MKEKKEGAVASDAQGKGSGAIIPRGPNSRKGLTRREHDRFCAIQVIIERESLKAYVPANVPPQFAKGLKVHPEFAKGVKAASLKMWEVKDLPLDELREWSWRLRRGEKRGYLAARNGTGQIGKLKKLWREQ